MNILISSTRQWNPGDEFIRLGVSELLRNLFGTGHNYLLWNRNPDLFVNQYEDDRMRTDFLTNSCKVRDISYTDMVVFAGTPEWFGNTVEPVFDLLRQYPGIPALFIGIGAGKRLDLLPPAALEVLKRDYTAIISRSKGLAASLNTLLQTDKAIDLPCPSLFCSPARHANRSKKLKIAVNMQGCQVICQSIAGSLVENFLACFPDPSRAPDVICSYIDEFTFYSARGYTCRYSFEPMDYFSIFDEYDKIVATRLHVALPALAMSIPAVLLASDDNVRIQSSQKMLSPILPIANTCQDAFAALEFQTLKDYTMRQDELKKFIDRVKRAYIVYLQSWKIHCNSNFN